MASAGTIPLTHVGTHSFQHDAGQPDPMEFPQLRPDEGDDWEMVQEPDTTIPNSDVSSNSFDLVTQMQILQQQHAQQVDKLDREIENGNKMITSLSQQVRGLTAAAAPQVKFELTHAQNEKQQGARTENPKLLLHSQSSPNLRDYTIEESDSDSESFEHVEQQASQDDASSNFSLVSGPPSVNSIWSSRISFKDALLKKDETKSSILETAPPKKQHGQHIKKIKPKFIVQQVTPIKHAKSMTDLMAIDEEILGDTDADEYYSRKAQGSLGRRNGRKQRPDEAKRLQMTMNKKNMQRARQGK